MKSPKPKLSFLSAGSLNRKKQPLSGKKKPPHRGAPQLLAAEPEALLQAMSVSEGRKGGYASKGRRRKILAECPDKTN